MKIYLAHAGLPGQGRLGDPLPLVEHAEQVHDSAVGEVGLILLDILVQIGLAHQLLLQIIGPFLSQTSHPPFTSRPKSSILTLHCFARYYNMLSA